VTIIAAEAIVAQALDDLEARRLGLPAVLRLVASIAWRQGHREGAQHRPARIHTSAPGMDHRPG
jgi:hypothetical protein